MKLPELLIKFPKNKCSPDIFRLLSSEDSCAENAALGHKKTGRSKPLPENSAMKMEATSEFIPDTSQNIAAGNTYIRRA